MNENAIHLYCDGKVLKQFRRLQKFSYTIMSRFRENIEKKIPRWKLIKKYTRFGSV